MVTGLVAREATRVSTAGVTTRVIRDGDRFTVLDSANFTVNFEFDSGPEVLLNYNPSAGLAITDGLQSAWTVSPMNSMLQEVPQRNAGRDSDQH